MREFFTTFASKAAQAVGSYWAFLIAVLVIVIWATTGPIFKYSDTWQLIINTGTTIITFIMVFLIQNTQNRDAKAMHLKLDELICAVKAAHNDMIDIEELSDDKLEEIAKYYRRKRDEHNDTTRAVAADVAEQTAHETAERVAGDTAETVADETAKRVTKEPPRRVA